MLRFLLFLAGRALAAHLPRRLLAVVGGLIGVGCFVVARDARGAVLRNLAVVAPGVSAHERRRLAARVFVHGVWSYLELLALSQKSNGRLLADVRVDGWEHLEAAVARGKGVIMVTGHLGTPSTAGQLLASRGYPTTVVVEPLHPPRLFRLMVSLREQTGLHLIPVGPRALRDILGALRRNEIVGIFSDRDVAGSGQMLPFFGRETRMSTAAAALALRTGAVIVPCVAYRTRPFRAVAEIGPAIELALTGDAIVDTRQGALLVIKRLEEYICRRPEQWVVFTDMWPKPSSTIPQSDAE